MLKYLSLDTETAQTTTNGTAVPLKYVDHVSAQIVVGDNPAAKGFISGTAQVQTLTFESLANSDAGDYFIIYDTTGQGWGISLDKTGSDPEPTGARWVALAAAKKDHVDISGATTAAQVAALVETAIDALTGFTAVIVTDDSAANGTMTFTQTVRAAVTASVFSNADDSGVGGITGTISTPAVASDIDLTNDLISEAAHGYLTGLKGQLTTSSALPTGLSALTDYFVIAASADTYKLAASLADANNGIAVDISAYGTGTQTFTPVAKALAFKLQSSNDNSNWDDITDATVSITTSSNEALSVANAGFKYIRPVVTITSGQPELQVYVTGKERRV
jgi:hypothetical protein